MISCCLIHLNNIQPRQLNAFFMAWKGEQTEEYLFVASFPCSVYSNLESLKKSLLLWEALVISVENRGMAEALTTTPKKQCERARQQKKWPGSRIKAE